MSYIEKTSEETKASCIGKSVSGGKFYLVDKTPDARAKKREIYQNRLADYEEALQNDPDWIKGKSPVNPKSPKARRTTNRTTEKSYFSSIRTSQANRPMVNNF